MVSSHAGGSGIFPMGWNGGPLPIHGSPVLLDADGTTYMISDTNDEIQFFAGGSEIAEFDATAITIASGTDLVMGATDKLYLDGGGNTYIHENSADQISFIVGGAVNKITSTYWSMPATNKLFLDGGGNTYLVEESADDLHIVVGNVAMMQIDQDASGDAQWAVSIGAAHAPLKYAALAVGGTFTTDGADTVAIGLNVTPRINPNALDVAYIANINSAGQIVTPGGGATFGVIAGLRVNEPAITLGTSGGADDCTLAASLLVNGAPTEGDANYAIYMATGAFGVSDGAGSDGEQLTSGGAGNNLDWSSASSVRSSKTAIVERNNNDEVLATLVNTPVHDFKYKNDKSLPSTGDYDTEYVGIMADEAPWAMHHSGSILNPINTFGYTVQAFKALEKRIQELESSNGN